MCLNEMEKENPLFEGYPFEWHNLSRGLEVMSVGGHALGLEWRLRKESTNRRMSSKCSLITVRFLYQIATDHFLNQNRF